MAVKYDINEKFEMDNHKFIKAENIDFDNSDKNSTIYFEISILEKITKNPFSAFWILSEQEYSEKREEYIRKKCI